MSAREGGGAILNRVTKVGPHQEGDFGAVT